MYAWPTRLTSGDAACGLDRSRHRPARPHVVDHLRARFLSEHQLGEQGRGEVAGHELAGVVDEEAAVRVAVVRDTEIGAFLARRPRRRTRGSRAAADSARGAGTSRPARSNSGRPRLAAGGRGSGAASPRPCRSRRRRPPVTVGAPRRRRTRAPCRRSPARRPPARTSPRRPDLTEACEGARSRTSKRPDSPPTGSAPRRTIFIPVYSFGLCEAVTQMPPSSPSSPTA